ncbi:hypothetical protein TorRG33x02_009630, partial [Trema orientale]
MAFTKNGRAMHILICGMDRDIFNNVEKATNAHDMWNMLEVTYQGTNSLKETKINILTCQYELFNMHKDETIAQIFSRFITVINSLNALGKSFSNIDLVNKVLRSLPRAYRSKVVAIQEAKDLTKLPLEELMGSLMTHEILMKESNEGDQEDN